jgi:hypothetical protein
VFETTGGLNSVGRVKSNHHLTELVSPPPRNTPPPLVVTG